MLGLRTLIGKRGGDCLLNLSNHESGWPLNLCRRGRVILLPKRSGYTLHIA